MLEKEFDSVVNEGARHDDAQSLKIGDIHQDNREMKLEEASEPIPPTMSNTKFSLLMVGLILSIFISSLDNTIVSTALTQIVSDFDAMSQVTWVVVAYLLTSTAMQPLYGKLSDIFGRKLTILVALVSFLIGSILCGASQNIIMLIVFRAFSGIGGGGLFSLSVIIISDVVPMKNRAIYMAMVGAVFALASVAGPLVGGAFTDYLTWRWSFYINIPICLITMVAVICFLDLPQPQGDLKSKIKRVDFAGTATLVTAIVCLVLALNWGGNDYGWDEWQVLLPLVLSAVILGVFIYIELKIAAEPIIPLTIFNRNIVIANLISFFHGCLFMVCIYYIPIYYQVVHQRSATNAGLELLPFLLGAVFCNIVNGVITTKTGIYRPISQVGTALGIVGICLLGGLFRPEITRAEEIIYIIILGFGIGLCYQNNTIISQAAAEEENVAVVTALVFFSNMLGGVFGVAVQGAIFNNALASTLAPLLPDLDIKAVTSSLHTIQALSSADQLIVTTGYFTALRTMFLSMIPFAVIPFLAALPMKHISLRGRGKPQLAMGH